MVYHPQGNSPIESFHNLFRSQMVACQEPRWLATQEYLDTILLAYRNSYHTALGDSPAFLTYGGDLAFPIIRDYATFLMKKDLHSLTTLEREFLKSHGKRLHVKLRSTTCTTVTDYLKRETW